MFHVEHANAVHQRFVIVRWADFPNEGRTAAHVNYAGSQAQKVHRSRKLGQKKRLGRCCYGSRVVAGSTITRLVPTKSIREWPPGI